MVAKKSAAPAKPEQEQVKATFYLSKQAIDAIEDLYYHLRKENPGYRTKISKSLIVQNAILDYNRLRKPFKP